MGFLRYVAMSAAGGAAFAIVMFAMYAVVLPAGSDIMRGGVSGDDVIGDLHAAGENAAAIVSDAGGDAADAIGGIVASGTDMEDAGQDANTGDNDNETHWDPAVAMPADVRDAGNAGNEDAAVRTPTIAVLPGSNVDDTVSDVPADIGTGNAPIPRSIPYATAQSATVTRVIDGDTLQVDREITIRLALVNTPERGQPGYAEATAFTRSECPVGSAVVYDADDGQRGGSYGRLIAMVWCSESAGGSESYSLNDLLVARGHAEIDTRFCGQSEFADDEWAKRGGC